MIQKNSTCKYLYIQIYTHLCLYAHITCLYIHVCLYTHLHIVLPLVSHSHVRGLPVASKAWREWSTMVGEQWQVALQIRLEQRFLFFKSVHQSIPPSFCASLKSSFGHLKASPAFLIIQVCLLCYFKDPLARPGSVFKDSEQSGPFAGNCMVWG